MRLENIVWNARDPHRLGSTLDWPGAAGRPWTVCADPSGNDFCVLAPA